MELTAVEYLTRKPLPWEDAVVIPLGDIQLQTDRNAVDMRRLKETLQWGIDHDAYWIGMGDMIDMESPSNRRALAMSGVYDSVIDALDAKAEELEEEIKELFKPTIGRWLGMLEGHHFHQHQTGGTTDTRLAEYVKCPFLGTSAYVNLTFKSPTKNGINPSFNIWAHHGRGGGGLAGTPLNNIEKRILGFDADIYLLGHTHTVGAVPRDRVYPYWGKTMGTLHHKKVYLVSTGAYLKGYEERRQRNGRAQGGYAEQGLMNPLALGSARIHFRPTWKRVGTHSGGDPVVEVSVEV
jgi:hypothetical protein